MFLGNYPHDPNRDAVLYFYENIWPRVKKEVPEALFYVVGKDPTPRPPGDGALGPFRGGHRYR